MDIPPIRDRTVLVTGGGGFIGSHLVDALIDHNDVRVLDNFSTGDRERVHDDATVLEGDVCDRDVVERATRDVDLIFHEAAIVDVPATVDRPAETNEVNFEAGLALLEQARDEDARVVLASSAAVYGHPAELPVPETASPEPSSPYGVQKLALEEYARLYTELYDVPTVSLRYFNVYGPRQQGPYSGVISTFLEQARAGEAITVEGDGEQTRDFVHVADVVRANLLAATTDDVGDAYNVGTGTRASILELAATIRDVVGADVPIVHRAARAGDVRHSGASISKARRELGFEATIDLEAGLRDLAGEEQFGDVYEHARTILPDRERE
ncbi:NAD-dependent epimerase/dehydratase family protein [Natrialbaceae archaeon AArc-T1-2]|uniref:NAD-dependent epimerase/dehydratase family protein n=1 Tax=Natrialbaceae archaeon AArc-T1-2 TaxID=3053904 RepID=UPI00255AA898|nr:NAD-dependent epimerase/dehydratase family protein [Natrialbaceae archaeon AArc-T1-2]WIV66192.1 NAD-dependent epimerase/dehydratase family protein [Natrialbaceae archaeon AArc-T1-2]